MSNYPEAILQKAKQVELLILDVDGVLTDGTLLYDRQGESIKPFNVKDGLGIKWLMKAGVQVAIITGKQSDMVARRAQHLGIKHVYQNQPHKIPAYEALLKSLGFEDEQVGYIGDDLPDLPIIQRVGLGIAVGDADAFVQSKVDFVTQQNGGRGAVREVCELLLASKGQLEPMHEHYQS